MCSTHWPKLIDLTRDEAKRTLRRLELDAYAAIITAFRAQGDLSKEKKKLLQDLQSSLSISIERHKAEVRRAVNDEKLTTIADHMNGPNVSAEWLIEGRRLVPLMPRLVPQTAFAVTASNAANTQAEKNQNLQLPSQTGKDIQRNRFVSNELKSVYAPPPAPPSNVATPTPATKSMRPQSPPSNVVILPSGMSIHIKGGVSSEEEDLPGQVNKRWSSSSDNYMSKGAPLIVTTASTTAKTSLVPQGMMAVPSFSTDTVQAQSVKPGLPVQAQPHQQQKVVMVSSSNSISTTPHQLYHQQKASAIGSAPRAISVNTTVNTRPTVTSSSTMSSVISGPGSSSAALGGVGNMGAVSSNSGGISVLSSGAGIQGTAAVGGSSSGTGSGTGMDILKNIVTVTSSLSSQVVPSVVVTQAGSHTPHIISAQRMSHPPQRTRTFVTRPRAPYMTHGGPRATMVIPSGSQTPHSGGPHIIKSTAGRPAIHIKQEGGMKIITQAVPSSGSHKYIPKHSGSGSNVVVVTTVTTPVSRMTAGGKILNISSAGGGTRVITASRQSGSGMVTVNPKSFHISSVKGSAPSSTVITSSGGTKVVTTGSSKPNVIVVQKAAHHHLAPQRKIMTPVISQPVSSHQQATATPKTPPSGAIQSPFEKELVSFIQKQDSQHRQILSQQQRGGERRLAPKTEMAGHVPQPKKITVVRQKADGTTTAQPVVIAQAPIQGNKSSILAELIQSRQQDGDMMIIEDQQAVATLTGESKDSVVQNQWVEMDAPIDQTHGIATENSDASAIKALLDLQSGQSKVRIRRESHSRSVYDIQSGVQVPQSDIITIDQSGNIVQQVIQEGLADNVQYIQADQGPVHIKDDRNGELMTEDGRPVKIEIASEEELARMGNVISQEIIGELDPNTGILYTNTPFDGQQIIDTGSISSITPLHKSISPPVSAIPNVVTQSSVTSQHEVGDGQEDNTSKVGAPSAGGSHEEGTIQEQSSQEDFLSSALGHAQINLDPYQFMEEDDGSKSQRTNVRHSTDAGVIRVVQQHPNDSEVVRIVQQHPESDVVQVVRQSDESSVVAVIQQHPGESVVETGHVLQQSGEGINSMVEESNVPAQMPDVIADVISSQPSGTIRIPPPQVKSQSVVINKERTHFINIQESNRNQVSALSRLMPQSASASSSVPMEPAATAVAVESTGLDPTSLQFSEFTSQKLVEGESVYTTVSEEHLQHAGALASPSSSSQDSLSDSLNKRKRKAPPKPDEIITQNQVGGWVRLALGLLQRVSKYRGLYKQKGDMNAASWFTHPVDPSEVPDYYNIIQYPMDLSTIKKKLESNQYGDWNDFHGDMMLIRDNCYQYNPEGSEVRMDCDEVFAFYLPEYDKCLQKWQQNQIGSPNSKKQKVDRSPVRSLSYS